MPNTWLSELNSSDEIIAEITEKLIFALNQQGTLDQTKKQSIEQIAKEQIGPFLATISKEHRTEIGLALCAFIYKLLSERSKLTSLHSSKITNLTLEIIQPLLKKEDDIVHFCQKINLEPQLSRQEVYLLRYINETAQEAFLTLKDIVNLSAFARETLNILQDFSKVIPPDTIILLLGNSPMYLYSLLAQHYRLVIIPMSGIKQEIIPKTEAEAVRLSSYLDQIFAAHGLPTPVDRLNQSFCILDYAATGAGLLAAHRILQNYLSCHNPNLRQDQLKTAVIPYSSSKEYEQIHSLLASLHPRMLLPPTNPIQAVAVTSEILGSKLLSRLGLKLCRQISLEDIIHHKVNSIPIELSEFINLQIIMKAIMLGSTPQELQASENMREIIYLSYSALAKMHSIRFGPEEYPCLIGVSRLQTSFFNQARTISHSHEESTAILILNRPCS